MKIRKYMVITILIGIFLAGIGTGIAFVEYSAFEYEGVVVLGAENTAETRLVWDLGTEKFKELRAYIYRVHDNDIVVQKDSKVPKDKVWFDITYNEESGEPVFSTDISGGIGSALADREAVAELWFAHTSDMEINVIMEAKDRILKELKEGKFSNYEYLDIISVKVLVNPSNYELLNIVN